MKEKTLHWFNTYNDIYKQFGDRGSRTNVILLAILGILVEILDELEDK